MTTKTKTTLLIENISLAKDLARVTAERDSLAQQVSGLETLDRSNFHKHQADLATLRARVAELEQSKRTVDFLCELHGCCPEMVPHWCEFEHRKLTRAESATPEEQFTVLDEPDDGLPDGLTDEAESATPAKHPDTELLDALDAAKCDLLHIVMDDQDGEPTRHLWILEDCDASKYRPDIRSAIIDGLAARKQGGGTP